MLRVSHHEHLRSMYQLAALAPIHGSGTTSERGFGPVADFDEHQRAVIQHHQVQLAAARLRIPRKELQAMPLQVGEGSSLDDVAAGAAIDHGFSARRRRWVRPRRR